MKVNISGMPNVGTDVGRGWTSFLAHCFNIQITDKWRRESPPTILFLGYKTIGYKNTSSPTHICTHVRNPT